MASATAMERFEVNKKMIDYLLKNIKRQVAKYDAKIQKGSKGNWGDVGTMAHVQEQLRVADGALINALEAVGQR